jgi:hypothetical protein
MTYLCIRLERDARLGTGELVPKGATIRVEGRARDCLQLVQTGNAAYVWGAPTALLAPLPSKRDNEPDHLAGVKNRYKEALLKAAAKLSLTATEPLPVGKSWLDVAAEKKWREICEKREKSAGAEAAAYAQGLAELGKQAEREEAAAKAALVRAEELRSLAARAAEVVTFEQAARDLKIARDTAETLEKVGDPRAETARERLIEAEAKFTEAEFAHNRYTFRVRAQRDYDAIDKYRRNPYGQIPQARITKVKELEVVAQQLLAADDFEALADCLAEIEGLLEPHGSTIIGGIGGPGLSI